MCQRISKQNNIIEIDTGDKSCQHFNKDIQGGSHAKNCRENIPGVEIVNANSTRQERPLCIQETQGIPVELDHTHLKLFQRATRIY